MPTIDELRERSERLFITLLEPQPERAELRDSAPERAQAAEDFSWFEPEHAAATVRLALRMAVRVGASDDENTGLQRALDLAQERGETEPALTAQALAIFVTHFRPARRLVMPRTTMICPELFAPSVPVGAQADERLAGASGVEAELDYWREDALANEHHEHWHQVYPFPGLLPHDWDAWALATGKPQLQAILEALDPSQDWATFVAQSSEQEIGQVFARAVDQFGESAFRAFIDGLPIPLFQLLVRLNDRQGELFFYMHSQMLARYDAERRSLGLPAVTAFGPTLFDQPIPEAYDPRLPGFGPRPAGQKLPLDQVGNLTTWQSALTDAITAGELSAPPATPPLPGVPITSDTLGEATEAADGRLAGLDDQAYPGVHNFGHGFIAALSTGSSGVMRTPVVAIRDPIFWRWHKNIDDINVAWQQNQPPYDFADAPPVIVRDVLDGQPAPPPWASPDILLVSTSGLPAGADPAAVAAAAFGGANVDTAFPPGPVPGGNGLVVVDELITRFGERVIAGQATRFLTHDPFALVVRVRNTGVNQAHVALRVFLAPAAAEEDRTAWIELDKSLVSIPAGETAVVFRADTQFSVIRKPPDLDPSRVLAGGGDQDDPNYCDCGWPYTLLLPRGTPEGMAFRLPVFCTDADADQLGAPGTCGSVSFCGAVERYPDRRDMGYPFARPMPAGVAATLLTLRCSAGTSLTIRHAG